jgi:elongation factor G
VVLLDGAAHHVDSSELAFNLASKGAFREAFMTANPVILEPIMDVSVTAPTEYQGPCIALINRRKGTINDSEVHDDYLEVQAHVSLNDMFGFSTDIRSITQGKGEFAMTYVRHNPVMPYVQEQLIMEHHAARVAARK